MKIYAAEYTDCVYESAFEVISLHSTKEGALEAMAKHEKREKFKHLKEWRVKAYTVKQASANKEEGK